MATAKDLKDQSLDELIANCSDLRKQLFNLASDRKQQGRQFEKPDRIRKTRKEIARLLTVINEKQSKAHPKA